MEYHQRVRNGFLTEAKRRPERITVVDASQSVENVQQTIRQAVQAFLENGGSNVVAAQLRDMTLTFKHFQGPCIVAAWRTLSLHVTKRRRQAVVRRRVGESALV